MLSAPYGKGRRNSNLKFFKGLSVGILLILLTGISIFESNGQSPSKLVVNAKLRDQCRSGDAKACEALGYSKPLATELAKIFRDEAKDPFSDRIDKVKDVELLVAYFRISGTASNYLDIEASRMTDMARNDPDPVVRWRAIFCCVDDLSLLLKLAKSDLSSEVRAEAVSKLKDPATLTEIAKKDSSPLVRLAAVKKLTDNVVIATIAKNDTDLDVRCQAISRITDENILWELFPQNPDSIILLAFLRSPALYKDTTLLKQLIQHLPGSSEVQKNNRCRLVGA